MSGRQSDDHRPVIVCGMGRSGTTLIKGILNTAGNLTVYSELKHGCLQATLKLLDEVRDLYRERSAGWRKTDDERAERNVSFILRHTLCGISGVTDPGRCLAKPRFGFKQPNAELYFEKFEELLGSIAPWYLYCWREPIDVYESYLSMPWGDTKPDRFKEELEASFGAAVNLLGKVRDRAVLLPVHTLSADQEHRTRIFTEMFDRIGLDLSHRTEEFLAEWPPVNTRDKVSAPPSVAPDEKQRRLEILEGYLEGNQTIEKFRKGTVE